MKKSAHSAHIRTLAYWLYEQRGCVKGHEEEDWLKAERSWAEAWVETHLRKTSGLARAARR